MRQASHNDVIGRNEWNKSKKLKPTATELIIFKALWKESPLSAREIHDRIVDKLKWSYSSTRKTLDRMSEKQHLGVSESHGIRVYTSQLSKVKTLSIYIKDFASRVLEVEGPLPVSMFADSKLLNPEEQKELEQLLEKEFKNEDSHDS
jgi:predicted transcriptional regulator